MGLCWIIGFAVGAVAQRTVQENIESYKEAHQIPEDDISDEAEADENEELVTAEVIEAPMDTEQSVRSAA